MFFMYFITIFGILYNPPQLLEIAFQGLQNCFTSSAPPLIENIVRNYSEFKCNYLSKNLKMKNCSPEARAFLGEIT